MRHAHAVVIEPDTGPQIVGSLWRRRDPQGDNWDRCRVVGIWNNGPDHGGLELVVTPVEFGPTLTADVESFSAAYVRDDDDPTLENLQQRLRALEARV